MDFSRSLTPPSSPGLMDTGEVQSSPVLVGKHHRNQCNSAVTNKSEIIQEAILEYGDPLPCGRSIHGRLYLSAKVYDDTLIGRVNNFWKNIPLLDLGHAHTCGDCKRVAMDQKRCLKALEDVHEASDVVYEATMYLQDLEDLAKEWARCTATQSSHHVIVAKKYRKLINEVLSFICEYFQESCHQEDVPIDSLVHIFKLIIMLSTQLQDSSQDFLKQVVREDLEMHEFGAKIGSSPLRELLHVQVDIQATIYKVLVKCRANQTLFNHMSSLMIGYTDDQDPVGSTEFHWRVTKNIFSQLIKLSIERYIQLQKNHKSDKGHFLQTILFRNSPFLCLCLQQLASLCLHAAAACMRQHRSSIRNDLDSIDTQSMLLGTFDDSCGSLESSAIPFWKMVSTFINTIIQEAQSMKSSNNFSDVVKPREFQRFDSVQDALSFCWWWTWHATHLFCFDSCGNFQVELTASSSCISLLSRLLRLSLTSCESDLKLLASHLICYQAISSFWRVSTPPLNAVSSGELAHLYLLWAHFSKKLNTTKKSEKLGMHKYTMKDDKTLSPRAWISKCERYLNYKNSELVKVSEKIYEDAFKVFLSIFGELISLGCWSSVKERFFSRLSSNDIKSLSDVGLSRLIQVFLIISLSDISNDERANVLEKLLEYLNGTYLSKTDYRKQKAMLNGLFACMLISIRFNVKSQDIATKCGKTISLLLKIFSESTKNLEQRNSLWRIIKFYLQNLTEIYQASRSFHLDQHLLIPAVDVHHIFMNTRSDETSAISDCLTTVLSSLSSHVAHSPGQDSLIGCANIFKSVCSSFLSWLKETVKTEDIVVEEVVSTVIEMCGFIVQMNESPFDASSLPVALPHLLEYFGCSVKVKLRARFLFLVGILSSENGVLSRFLNAQTPSSKSVRLCIIQGAFKCIVSHHNEEDQRHLLKLLIAIDDLRNLMQYAEVAESGDISFGALLHAMEVRHNVNKSFTERKELVSQVSSWFNPLSEVIRSFAKSYATAEPQTVMNVYRTCALIAQHCHAMLYSRGTPSIIVQIFDFIVLPRWVYASREKNILPAVMRALSRTLHMYVRCLLSIESPGDNYIKRVLSDLVGVYLIRFPAGSNSASHPFQRALGDSCLTSNQRSVLIKSMKDGCFKGPDLETKLVVTVDILYSWVVSFMGPIAKDSRADLITLLERCRSTVGSQPAVMRKVEKIYNACQI